jgi:hypothetical protein
MNIQNKDLRDRTIAAKMLGHLRRWDMRGAHGIHHHRAQYRKLIRKYPRIAKANGFEERV